MGERLGAIELVIASAAGKFLGPIHSLLHNAFKSVLEIDVLGSCNAAKFTLPYTIASAGKHEAGGEKRKAVSLA